MQPLVPTDPYQAEVALFGVRSILDVLIDEEVSDVNRPFLDAYYSFISQ